MGLEEIYCNFKTKARILALIMMTTTIVYSIFLTFLASALYWLIEICDISQ